MADPRLGAVIAGQDWSIRTDLSPADCLVRLRVAAPEGWTLLSRHSVIGEFGADGGYIRRIGFIDHLFPPVLRFRLAPDGAGSRIAARSGLHWGVFLFVALWVLVVLIQADVEWGALLSGADAGRGLMSVLPLAAIGPLLLVAGHVLARRGGRRLATFLAETVDGRIVA